MGKKHSEKEKKKSKHKKRERKTFSHSSTSSSSSIDEETKRKLKKKIKKIKKKEKEKRKEKKALKKLMKSKLKKEAENKIEGSSCSFDVDVGLMEKAKTLAPMTKEEWEKQQNTLRRVYDEDTGRMREMTLTVHGFPSDVSALRFEWAWQHPKRSRRLKLIVPNKKASESSFEYCLKIMFTMLRTPPWSRLPLTIRWLSADVVVEPPPNLTPPVHMPIVYGPVISKRLKSPKKKSNSTEEPNTEEKDEVLFCQVCHQFLDKADMLICLNNRCQARWHVLCLARRFLEQELPLIGSQSCLEKGKNIIPVEGCCPDCGVVILWGDLVRKRKGCYNEMTKPGGDSSHLPL